MPAFARIQRLSIHQVFLGALVLILTIGLLKVGQSIFLPIGLGVCLAFILMPLTDRLNAWKIPRLIASLLSLLLASAFLGMLGLFLSISLRGVQQKLPYYAERSKVLVEPLIPWLKKIGLGWDIPSLLAVADRGLIAEFAGSSLLWALDLVAQAIIVFFVCLFALIETGRFRRKLANAFGIENIYSESAHQIAGQIQRYLVTKSALSLGVGLVVWVFLTMIDVDFAFLWAFLAFLLNYIPNLGPVIASVPPTLLAMVQFNDPFGYGLTVATGLLAIHMIIGNYIDPLVTGGTLDLSALVIFLNLCFWGWLWGPMGMFISVPIVVAVKVTLAHIPATAQFATLLDE